MASQKEKNNIVVYETPQGKVKLSPEIIRKYLVNGNGRVTDQEVMMFLHLCYYQKLNPFLREAYLIKYGDEPATIVTGKETFTKRAASIPDCNGWIAGVVVLKDGKIVYRPGSLVLKDEELVGGWAEVYRKSWSHPIRIEVSYEEYEGKKKDGTPNRQWKRMPGTMIRKVALVQALREAFPNEFGGLYSPEEMAQAGVDMEGLPQAEVKVEEDIEEQNGKCTTKQIALFHKILSELEELGIDAQKRKELIKQEYKVESIKELSKEQMSIVIDELVKLRDNLREGKGEVKNEIEEVLIEEDPPAEEVVISTSDNIELESDRPTKGQLAALQALKEKVGKDKYREAMDELGIANEAELTYETAGKLIMALQS
mgnify:CR=1 FL=1